MLQCFIIFPEFAEFTELLIHLGENSIVIKETVKQLNILRFAYHKDQNKGVHKVMFLF